LRLEHGLAEARALGEVRLRRRAVRLQELLEVAQHLPQLGAALGRQQLVELVLDAHVVGRGAAQ
jgi:hypothetical protein